MRLLIVEDNEMYRLVLTNTILSRFPSIDILEAGNADRGLQLARERVPDMVLVDIQLPDGNGLDLAGTLVREFPHAAVAICTSYDHAEYREAVSALGIDTFIPKDQMTPDRILDLVQETLSCAVS